MGPSKRMRVNSKRLTKLDELPDKEGAKMSKKKVKKRKLSDMLGSEWSNEELRNFYKVYRKYGKNWEKVASILQNRSVEMVEALYNMNRAYLSLPDGTATVAGLIAMMTDHYNILDGSDNDRARSVVSRIANKPNKRDHGKLRIDMSKDSDGALPNRLWNQSGPSSYGCLSLLKRNSEDLFDDSRPRAVGKRTPRISVADIWRVDGRVKIVSPVKRTCKPVVDADVNEIAHLAALALVDASKGGPSAQISGTTSKETEHIRSSPVQSGQRKDAEAEMPRTNFIGARNDNLETSVSMQAETEASTTASRLVDTEAVGDVKADRKVKKFQGERPQGPEIERLKFDDVREAHIGTARSLEVRNVKYDSDTEVAAEDTTGCTSQRPRKKILQLTRDDNCALDGLHTLADASLNISLPSSVAGSEYDAHVSKQEREIDAAHEPKMTVAISKNQESIQSRTSLKKDRGCSTIANPDTQEHTNHRKNEATRKNYSKTQNRKRKCLSEEVSRKDTKKPCVGPLVPLPKEGNSIQPIEYPTLSKDLEKSVAESASQDSSVNHINVPARSRNRRKMALQKAIAKRELSERVGDQSSNEYSFLVNGGATYSQEGLDHCLSSKMLRRWCACEWFYSAIDYPWFTRNEFEEYLDHVRLGHVPRLTQVEWSVIRSSMGKVRRFSRSYLLEERKKLELYRESVRTYYAEVRSGVREGLPTDLPRPLSVGQRVCVLHPKTRELHNGSVLTIDYNTCKVQFDRPDLGIEIVPDIDCMPLNLRENVPQDLRKQTVTMELWNRYISGKPDNLYTEVKLNRSKIASCESSDVDRTSPVASSKDPWSMSNVKDIVTEAAEQQAISNQPSTLAQIQEREPDIHSLDDPTPAHYKKEHLLTVLRQMNEGVSRRQKCGDLNKDYELLEKHYPMALLQLQDAKDHVASALVRQCNSLQINSSSRPMVNLALESLSCSDLNQDSRSHVAEIVESSRHKARTMVDAAVQAMPSLKETEDAHLSTEGPLNPGADSTLSRTICSSSCARNSSVEHQDQGTACGFELRKKANGLNPAVQVSSKTNSNSNEAQLPSGLISSCVATLLMIQTCTDGNYPPAEVAQIVEYAVNSLQPYCQQNLPIYREIEICMGIIKSQMLALVPTPSNKFQAQVSV